MFFVTAVGRREQIFKVGLGVNHTIKNRFSITAKLDRVFEIRLQLLCHFQLVAFANQQRWLSSHD